MKYVQSSSAHNLFIEFFDGAELVVPDNASVKLTLTKNDGSVISGYNQKAISTNGTDSFVTETITSLANTPSLPVELRTAKVEFTYSSKPCVQFYTYMLVSRVDIPVSPSEVRLVLGLSADELADDQIDVIGAYVRTDEDLGDTSANNILAGGTTKVHTLLDAIKLRAAIEVLPVIELLAAQNIQADNVVVGRFQSIDFDGLRQRLVGLYNKALQAVSETSITTPVFATTGVGTDAVTGE